MVFTLSLYIIFGIELPPHFIRLEHNSASFPHRYSLWTWTKSIIFLFGFNVDHEFSLGVGKLKVLLLFSIFLLVLAKSLLSQEDGQLIFIAAPAQFYLISNV